MKEETAKCNMTQGQNRLNLQEVETRKQIFNEKRKTSRALVPNHPTFGVAGGKLCNGPPGRARSPGNGRKPNPDHPPNCIPDRVFNPVRDGTKTEPISITNQVRLLPENFCNTEYQLVINIKPKFQFITNIKFFKIMKKQILILAFFVLAMMAGSLSSYGQALLPGVTKPGAVAPLVTQPLTPLSCTTGTPQPLHPFAGVAYDYSMTNGTGATSANWTWWATKNPNFITAGTPPTLNLATQLTVASNALLATSPNPVYGVDNSGGALGANTVSITWSANILAATKYQGDVTAAGTPADPSPTFVVGYSKGAAGCTDNIEVFEINPLPNFVVDIAPIDTTIALGNWTQAWGATVAQCVDNVQSALYNNTSKALDMNYGKDNFYFEVTAANFNTSWNPAFTVISGLSEGQQARISIYASLADARAGINALDKTATLLHDGNVLAAPSGATPAFSWDPDIDLTASVPADAATGVSLYVRVTVYNGTFESLAANPFELAVDARDFNDAGIWDMEDSDCPGGGGANEADGVDTAIENITPRPTLEMDGPGMNEPNTVNPDDVINKTQVPKP
jgi:hypothetical protein